MLFAFLATSSFAQIKDSVRIAKEIDSLNRYRTACIADNEILNIDYVNTLDRLAKLYGDNDQYERAELCLKEAFEITEIMTGKESNEYAALLTSMGMILKMKGNIIQSLQYMEDALRIYAKVTHESGPQYAQALTNCAALNKDIGNYEKSLELAQKALYAEELAGGKESLKYSLANSELGNVYFKMGQYDKAMEYQIVAKDLLEPKQDKHYTDYANCLNSLAIAYLELGDFKEAELLLLECRSLNETHHGENYLGYAACLNNLAHLYTRLSTFDKAEAILNQVRVIFEDSLKNTRHQLYMNCLANLAHLYLFTGHLDKSELIYIEVNNLRKLTLGTDNNDYAQGLEGLGDLYFNSGRFDKAEQCYLETNTIRKKINGENHPDYAFSLFKLAYVNLALDDLMEAEKFLTETQSIQERILGISHPRYSRTVELLIALHELKNEDFIVDSLMALKVELIRSQIIEMTTYLSGNELTDALLDYSVDQKHVMTSLYSRSLANRNTSALSSLAYDEVVFYKGYLLNAANRINLLSSQSPEAIEVYDQFKSAQRSLASELSKPLKDQIHRETLRTTIDNCEKKLARIIDGYVDIMRQVKWQEIQKTLLKNEATIEFVDFENNFWNANDSVMYGALILRADGEAPVYVPLCEKKQLDSLLQTNGELKADYVNAVYAGNNRGITSLKTKCSLYDLLWKPMEPLLKNVNKIYYSATGLLHRVNMGAIPVTQEQVIADNYRMVQMASTRQLVVPVKAQPAQHNALLFGGIQYNIDATIEPAIEVSINSTDAYRGEEWNLLTWTDKEVTSIQKILEQSGIHTVTYKDLEASEEKFREIGNDSQPPYILHIATHGFFFPQSSENVITSDTTSYPVFKYSTEPMMRSGLLMAGANYSWTNGSSKEEGREDGILTALEISQMNLSGTELVVLSACETGLGVIKDNEGVYGLQRAFKIAGAKYIIMSLWQVPDKQTSMLMTTFYKKWLEEKMTIPSAFHAAQKELRDMGFDPYQWAGFVLVE